MSDAVKVALAQIDLVVGDVAGNTAKIIEYAERARDRDAQTWSYFRSSVSAGTRPRTCCFMQACASTSRRCRQIRDQVFGIAILIGFPEYDDDHIYNACAVLRDGHVLAHYRKHLLPNYAVFDEERYFTAGKDAAVFTLNGIRIGLNICEDVWSPGPIAASRSAGAEVVVAINGSPFEKRSQEKREAWCSSA